MKPNYPPEILELIENSKVTEYQLVKVALFLVSYQESMAAMDRVQQAIIETRQALGIPEPEPMSDEMKAELTAQVERMIASHGIPNLSLVVPESKFDKFARWFLEEVEIFQDRAAKWLSQFEPPLYHKHPTMSESEARQQADQFVKIGWDMSSDDGKKIVLILNRENGSIFGKIVFPYKKG